jgi:hypothetical protein
LLQEIARVAVVVSPGAHIADLVLHGHADGQEVDGWRLFSGGIGDGAGIGGFAAGHQEMKLFLVMGNGPKHRGFLVFPALLVLEANVEHLDFLRPEAMQPLERPGQFQMETCLENVAPGQWPAERSSNPCSPG